MPHTCDPGQPCRQPGLKLVGRDRQLQLPSAALPPVRHHGKLHSMRQRPHFLCVCGVRRWAQHSSCMLWSQHKKTYTGDHS